VPENLMIIFRGLQKDSGNIMTYVHPQQPHETARFDTVK
jgi:hypothetical protein